MLIRCPTAASANVFISRKSFSEGTLLCPAAAQAPHCSVNALGILAQLQHKPCRALELDDGDCAEVTSAMGGASSKTISECRKKVNPESVEKYAELFFITLKQ
ncbi:hypothetical protein GOODEAATRI_014267 [Goodea atripinnis]|uniref:Uncharacterized protein n=1 Tax=Goodea atripinnis TaxID=208336 RepID=A0ABV0PXY5_9TELE